MYIYIYIYIYIIYTYIYKLSTEGAKTLPGPGYLHSKEVVV